MLEQENSVINKWVLQNEVFDSDTVPVVMNYVTIDRIVQLLKELQSASSSSIAQVDGDISAASNQIATISAEISIMDAVVDSVSASIATMTTNITNLQTLTTSLNSRLTSLEDKVQSIINLLHLPL